MTSAMALKLFFTAVAVAFISIGSLFSPESSDSRDLSKDELWRSETLPIAGAVGPESFAFDPLGGGPYTGVSDGRIIKWQADERRWVDFAVTSPTRDGCQGSHDHDQTEHKCGRPLGLHFNPVTGDLYIADAYKGLLVVGGDGGLATEISTQPQHVPSGFTNSLDIDESSGEVYFTESSTRYKRRNYVSVIWSGDRTGRLMKYDPKSKRVSIIVNNLAFPNGVALSENGDFVLIAETTTCRILRFWLNDSSRAGSVEVVTQLPGFPDNIKRNREGEFWVGIHWRRRKFVEWALSIQWISNAFLELPFDKTKLVSFASKWIGGGGMAVKLSEEGEVLGMLEDRSGKTWKSISEVHEKNGVLWIGSVTMPFAGIYKTRP